MKYYFKCFISFIFLISCDNFKKDLNKIVVFRETPQNLISIVDDIKRLNIIEHEKIGFVGGEGENHKNYKKLVKLANEKELVDLTFNENPVVACYASWGLSEKSYSNLKDIFNHFLENDKEVKVFNGCNLYQSKISSVLYFHYCNKVYFTTRKTDKILFQLDSLVLKSKNLNRNILSRVLENRIYDNKLKKQIEILAFEGNNIEAIMYLSNWHKAEYVDDIKKALVNYLEETNFKNTGITDYFEVVSELFKFKEETLTKKIITKMKKDKHWENDKKRFELLLEDNYIYDLYEDEY